jgi:hypothetical protein
MIMRPSDPETMKIMAEAHLEALRGGRRRPAFRRTPRKN